VIRRICLYGGAGAGKSGTGAYLFSELKKEGFETEFIPEYVKGWTYINRQPKNWDQLYLLAKQLHKEEVALQGGVDYVVCESPLLLNNWYAHWYDLPGKDEMLNIIRLFEKEYPATHIFLDRGDIKYSEVGRFHSKEEALKKDESIKKMLEREVGEYHIIPTKQRARLIFTVMSELHYG